MEFINLKFLTQFFLNTTDAVKVLHRQLHREVDDEDG